MKSYLSNAINLTKKNNYFRKVIFTGRKSQLVLMDIKPREDIGEETHKHVEQTLFLLSGKGKSILNGKSHSFNPGDVIVVTPGTKHNFVNIGKTSMKIYTIYSPPNHISKRIHKTKRDAEKDIADEEFGDKVR